MDKPQYWQQFPGIDEKDTVTTHPFIPSDGIPLSVHHFHEPAAESFIAMLPTSTPSLLMFRLAARLARDLPVICWEPRGSTFMPNFPDWKTVTVHRHVQDLTEIASQRGIRTAHLVTWCSSTDIAAYAARNGTLNIASVTAIAPTLTYVDSNTSGFRKLFVPMLRSLPDANEEEASRICRSIRTLASLRIAHNDDDALVQKLTYLNFSAPDRIRHYAGLIRAFHRTPSPEERRLVLRDMFEKVPTFMMCFADDEVVGTKVFSQLAGSRLQTELQPKGTHFAPFRYPDLVYASLSRFFGSIPLTRAKRIA